MLHDISILNTASSFFNNIALVSPFFLLVGLLTVPLYVMVYKYGFCFVSNFGWNKNNLLNNICLCTAVMLIVYSILFGGNYDALRDHFSVLPFLIAIILFGLSTILSHEYNIRKYIEQLHISNRTKILILPCLLLLIAFSGLHTWWGILLQLSSCVSG
ncbi:MAG: hypothetical protein MJ156_02395, partial [Alphaproteobacteria bacterium]|nr:hypothetical protein [Alphaproteobacteria bacterium]